MRAPSLLLGRRAYTAAIAVAAAAALAASTGTASAVIAPPTAAAAHEDTVDARDDDGIVRPLQSQVDAVRALLGGAPGGARVTWDERFGTPRSIRSTSGYLTAPRTGTAVSVARAWVDANRAAFGLTAADVAALAVVRDHTIPGTGTHAVTFAQVFGGVQAVHGGRLNVAVTKDGRVLSYAGTPQRSSGLVGGWSTLSEAGALAKAAAELAPGVAFSPAPTGSRAGYTTFAAGPFAAGSYVKKAVFPTRDGARAAYRVLFVKALDEAWDAVVAADNGAVLYSTSIVDHAAEGTVYENFPGDPDKGGSPVVKSFGPTPQSPAGWVDPTGVAGVPGPTTFGNNANTYANYSNFLVPADQAPRPVSPTSQFNYAYGMNWQRTNGQTVPPSYALDLDPAATNLFFHHNRIHDEFYRLGFTETGGNFQVNNNGNGGQGGDPILGLVHAGAASGGAPTYTGRDNAYMLTLDDGLPPWSGMFLWEPINDAFEGPYSDGNFDASVIEHEYAHGLTNRYVAGGAALGSFQAGSMGEGWGDWYALNYMYGEGLQNKAVVGEYATGNGTRGIRNYDYDQNPTTFGDIGYDVTGPEVHADGEIWTTALWDLRKALVARYGAAAGGERAARLITDAMPLSAPEPSFLDMRDAILSADVDRYHGDTAALIWKVFAKRGMGASARSATGDDIDPTPGFDSGVASANGTLVGTVVNSTTGEPVVGARVIFGKYEARVSPVARTSSTGGFGTRAVAGTYPVLIQAPGFGVQSFSVTLAAGATKSLKFSLTPNLVSTSAGATVVSTSSEDVALVGRFLVDDTAATVWSTKKGATPYNSGPDQRVTVKLPKLATVSAIQVSAFKNTASPRFAAMKDFTFQVSKDGVSWTTVKKGGFGYQAPRPVAPDLNYKRFALASPVQAQYVRFFIDSVQGDTTALAQAAELQVFGKAGTVTTTTPPADAPFSDSGTIAAGNPSAGDPTGLQNVFGVTGTEFTTNCGTVPPASQGVDGWVSRLPSGFGHGTHTVAEVADATPARRELDVYFLDSSCELIGAQATSGADESAVIPGGTAYVLTHLWSGADVPFTLTAKSAQ